MHHLFIGLVYVKPSSTLTLILTCKTSLKITLKEGYDKCHVRNGEDPLHWESDM